MQSDQYRSCSTVKRRGGCRSVNPDGEQPKQRYGAELAKYIDMLSIHPGLYTRGLRGRMKAKQRWFKVTVTWMVSSCSASCSWRPLYWRIRQCFDVYAVSQSRSVVTSAEKPASENSPQSIGELRNGHTTNLQKLYTASLVRKMAWYKILIHVLIL